MAHNERPIAVEGKVPRREVQKTLQQWHYKQRGVQLFGGILHYAVCVQCTSPDFLPFSAHEVFYRLQLSLFRTLLEPSQMIRYEMPIPFSASLRASNDRIATHLFLHPGHCTMTIPLS